MRLLLRFLAAAVAATTGSAFAQAIVTDSFDRTTGDAGMFGDPNAEPPIEPVVGFSDWGSTDGGTAGSQPYRVVTDPQNPLQETTDGSVGLLNFGRTLLDYNLAAAPGAAVAQSIQITVDINPGDSGDPFHGRDWAGLLLADTNSLIAIGGSAALFSASNQDARVGAAPRNSGTMLIRQGPANIRAAGRPGSLNEPVIDPTTWNDYQNWFAGADGTDFGDPVAEFPRDIAYTFRIVVSRAPGTTELFESNALHEVEYQIRLPGESTFTTIATGLPNNNFSWGDNQQSAGSPAGDYNDDGFVDAADYTAWRNNEGRGQFDDPMNPYTLPNDPYRGTIDDRQFEQWAANYGIASVATGNEADPTNFDPTPGQNDAYLVFVGNAFDHQFDNLVVEFLPVSATATAIPEPTSVVLLGLLAGMLSAGSGRS